VRGELTIRPAENGDLDAIHAIGNAAAGRGIYEGPGISIKLSALHPRYSRAQRTRVLAELWPRVRALTMIARQYDIGLNIDAEEADRLDLSLDLLEALCFDAGLEGDAAELGFVHAGSGRLDDGREAELARGDV